MLLLASAVIFTHANIAFARCTSPSYYADAESQCNSLIERIVRETKGISYEQCIADWLPYDQQVKASKAKYEARCDTICERSREIYDNSIIAKMPDGKIDSSKRRSIKDSCDRISCKPSFLDKMRY